MASRPSRMPSPWSLAVRILRQLGPLLVAGLLLVEAIGLVDDGKVVAAGAVAALIVASAIGLAGERRAEREAARTLTVRQAAAEEMRDAARRIAAVAHAQTQIAAGAGELGPTMRVVAAAASDIVGGDGAVVELPDGDDMVYRAVVGAAETHLNVRVPAEGSLSGLAQRSGQTLSCSDTECDGRVDREACRAVGVRSMVCVPLRHDSAVIGVVKVMAARPHAFSERDERTLELLAAMAAAAVHRAQAEHRLAAAHAVVHALAGAQSLEAGLVGALRALSERLGWDVGAVWLEVTGSGTLERVAAWHAAGIAAAPYLDAAGPDGKAARALREGARWVQRLADAADVARRDGAAAADLRTAAFVPIVSGGRTCGVVELAARAERTSDAAELDLITTAATQIGEFVRRRQAEERNTTHRANLEAVVALSHRLSSAPADELRVTLCRAIRDFAHVSQVLLLEPDPAGRLVVTAQAGDLLPIGLVVDPADGPSLTLDVFRAGTGRFVPDMLADAGTARKLIAPTGLRSAHIEPVLRDGRVVAVLALTSRELREQDAGGLGSLMRLLAVEAASSLALADLVCALDARARTDELTGLANRRAWDEALPRELARAGRTRAPLTVAMVDVDHFKAYNDTYGHPAGDRLLRAAAAGWSARLRSTDVIARYGGEEFAVALPGCDVLTAIGVADELRSALPEGTTCSIGLATWDGVERPDALIARADAALYRAKREGRDRVAAA